MQAWATDCLQRQNRWKSHLNGRNILNLERLRRRIQLIKNPDFCCRILYVSCFLDIERHKQKRISAKMRTSLLYRKWKCRGGLSFTYLNAGFQSGILDTRWRSRDRQLQSRSSLISLGPRASYIYTTQNPHRTSGPSANHPNTKATINYNTAIWMSVSTSKQNTEKINSILLMFAFTTQFLLLTGSPCPQLALSVRSRCCSGTVTGL